MSLCRQEHPYLPKWQGVAKLVGVMVLAGALLPHAAVAETTECKVITSVPTVIDQQGIWCAKADLSTNIASGAAIEITVNNVTIDFNGFKLGNLAAGPNGASGVRAVDRKNITVRNGNIRGYEFGVDYRGGEGLRVEDSSFDQNGRASINVGGQSNSVSGAVIVRNTVKNVDYGGTTIGIYASGNGIVIDENVVTNISATNNALGIWVWNGSSNVWIRNNFIAGLVSVNTNTFGIGGDVGSFRNYNVSGNMVSSDTNLTWGVVFFGGTDLFCVDNTVINASSAYTGCTTSTGNLGVDTPPALTSGEWDDWNIISVSEE